MIAALAAIVADTMQALVEDQADRQELLDSVLEQLSGLVEYCATGATGTGAEAEAVMPS
ncbi:hypothetical protein KGQ20_39510 [Catenulispora sp. NF23]|uniref:hypothetical protein n=1 Tax=Catenulispora pinistramenti TaxID=2705254 RepID=UPI001BAC29EB|nr:hypothetical protein [Catenulispora pinistramenti]MBS2538852.1 hypothetical protein [Catenulispora pinistramenti]